MEQRDAQLVRSVALPSAAATVIAPAFDTGLTTPLARQTADVEYELATPTLSTAQLPDGATMKYDIIVSLNADLSAPTILIGSSSDNLTQTGAAGAGALGQTYRFHLPNRAPRYVGFRATNSNAADASAATASLALIAY